MQAKKNTVKYRWSLKLKWAIGTSVGALIIFACLTFVLFHSFTQDLLKQETTHVNQTVKVLKRQLGQNNAQLTSASVKKTIRPNELVDKGASTPRRLYRNDVVKQLSSTSVIVNITDVKGNSLFTTGKSQQAAVTREKKTQVVANHSKKMIVANYPIRSQKNHQIIGYVHVENLLANYYDTYDRLIIISILVLILVILASGLMGYFLSYFLLRPIDDIHDTLSEMKNDPTSEKRVPEMHRNDELSDLANMFNDMLDQMQRYIEQQSQFVEDVSHELRTPVAIIQGHMEMLNRWGKDDPKVLDESLSASLKETKRMQDLVQEMLDLSRAEQVEINFRDEQTEVRDVVHQVYNNFKMIHPDFLFMLDDDLKENVWVQIYRDHLEQILIILCDNAVKYSTKRKEIHLSLSRSTKQIEIGIQDFGEGISQEDMNKVFNRFYRVDKARSRKKGGNGLGLSIAQRLVEGYHGQISLESSLGSGSLFRITLPISKITAIEDK